MQLEIKRCTQCLMPETKPGLTIHADGKCDACKHDDAKQHIDYRTRIEELKELCNTYRRNDGGYDCIIPVSGGKDSHYVVYKMKELMHMNPLLVMVKDNYSKTKTGLHDLNNLREITECDLISLDICPSTEKNMTRIAFEEFGSPTWPIDQCIYTFPLRVAIEKDIPLIIYGEDTTWEYGGVDQQETPSALKQINNDAVKPVAENLWESRGILTSQLNQMKYPSVTEIADANLNPIYLSYYVPWSGYHNYYVAQQLGFRELFDKWDRGGYVDNYDQIDSIGYLMNVWMKYPKFGFHRTTDMVGNWIRDKFMDVIKGNALIDEKDHLLDPYVLSDFLQYTGYTEDQFWNIVDKFWNKDIFTEDDIAMVKSVNKLPMNLVPLDEIAPTHVQETNTCDYSCKRVVG